MSEMDDNEILAEALAMAEMIAKDLEKIYIPETELKCLLETKQLPEKNNNKLEKSPTNLLQQQALRSCYT